MVATGFIAYVRNKEGFNMALVTNNHVIKTAEDAMTSQIAFENVSPDRKVTLKGFQIFLKEKVAFRCSHETEVLCVCMCVCMCVYPYTCIRTVYKQLYHCIVGLHNY